MYIVIELHIELCVIYILYDTKIICIETANWRQVNKHYVNSYIRLNHLETNFMIIDYPIKYYVI